jgi:hypothetical protein
MVIQTKQPQLIDAAPEQSAELETRGSDVALMFERLATNPAVDVEKFERLMAMQERIIAHQARAAFNAAFSLMQGEIPVVIERAKTNNGTYAPLEDIQDAIRPVLMRHGFSLSFRTEWPDAKTVKVIGILRHREGHEQTSEFLSAADASGNKNMIQGLGSAVSYGRRYTTKDLLNITSRGADDDGERGGGKPEQAAAPAGYDDWISDMAATSDEGTAALESAWKKSKAEYRTYTAKHNAAAWASLKTRAGKVRA